MLCCENSVLARGEKMSIVLCENQDRVDNKIFGKLNENSVVFSSDYYAGKHFIKQRASEKYQYYYFYQNKLYSFENREDILSLQHLLVSQENYDEAKTFNEFLMNVSRIKGLKQWLFYPMIIQLEHTNRCNARCIMCGHANVDKKKCFDMADDTFHKIEELLPFCKYVGLHGYGEPFLAKDLKRKFETYKKYGVRLYANTNLSYLPESYLPYIADMFDEINVSIDGFTKQTFEFIRQGLSFEKVTENFKTLTARCPDVIVNIHATLMRQNILEAPMAIEFAYQNRVQKVVFNEMIPLDANGNHDDSINKYPAATAFMLKTAIKRAAELGIKVEFPQKLIRDYSLDEIQCQIRELKTINAEEFLCVRECIIKENGLLFNRQPLTDEMVTGSGVKCHGICDVFQQQIYVDADGTMAACCVDGYHSIGKIKDFEDIEDYWNSQPVCLLRDSFDKGELPAICRQCNYVFLNNLKNLQII